MLGAWFRSLCSKQSIAALGSYKSGPQRGRFLARSTMHRGFEGADIAAQQKGPSANQPAALVSGGGGIRFSATAW